MTKVGYISFLVQVDIISGDEEKEGDRSTP